MNSSTVFRIYCAIGVLFLSALTFESCKALASNPHPSEPVRNYLRGLWPHSWFDVFRPGRLTDGVVDVEGAEWNALSASGFGPSASHVTFQLPESAPIRGVVVQSDANDGVRAEVSENGTDWQLIWSRNAIENTRGMRLDSAAVRPIVARLGRIVPFGGDHKYGVSEFQLLSRAPSPEQPTWSRRAFRDITPWSVLIPEQAVRKSILGAFALISVAGIFALGRTLKLAGVLSIGGSLAALALCLCWTFGFVTGFGSLAILVAVYLAWIVLTGFGRTRAVRVAVFSSLALSGVFAWTNFGKFHGAWSPHYHDAFHYFMGAKYSSELGYPDLYNCAYLAERDSGKWPSLANREIRDLGTNQIGLAEEVVRDGNPCRSHFSAPLWREFVTDTDFFIAQIGHPTWAKLLLDHGFNASPAWSAIFRPLFLRMPVTERSFNLLSMLDPALYSVAFGAFAISFGLETATLAILLWGLGFPWIVLWTGGGIGRAAWFAAFAIGLALLRRRKTAFGGIALGASAAVQALPAVSLIGPGLSFFQTLFIHRRIDRVRLRLLVAAGITGFLLLGAGGVLRGSIGYVGEFLKDARLHADTHFKNQMGLAVVSPGGEKATAKSPLERNMKVLCVIAFVFLWGMTTLRLKSTWEQAAFGLFLWVGLLSITSYYYVFIALLAPLALHRLRRWTYFLSLTIATQWPLIYTYGKPDGEYYVYATLLVMTMFILYCIDVLFLEKNQNSDPDQLCT